MAQESGAEAHNEGEYGDSAKVYPFGVDPSWHIAENEVRCRDMFASCMLSLHLSPCS